MTRKHIKEIDEAAKQIRKLTVDVIGADSIEDQRRIANELSNAYAKIAGITTAYLTLED